MPVAVGVGVRVGVAVGMACHGQAPTQNQKSKSYTSTMMATSSSLFPVMLIPFLMLVNALHEFLCRFYSLFLLGLGLNHNFLSILLTRLSVRTAVESSSTRSAVGISRIFHTLYATRPCRLDCAAALYSQFRRSARVLGGKHSCLGRAERISLGAEGAPVDVKWKKGEPMDLPPKFIATVHRYFGDKGPCLVADPASRGSSVQDEMGTGRRGHEP